MPIYHDFIWEDFKVSVRPTGIRRVLHVVPWRPFNIPYFTGSNVNLVLTIEVGSGEVREFAYHWQCFHESSDGIATSIERGDESFLNNPQNAITRDVRIPYLSSFGHYVVELQLVYPVRILQQTESKKVRIVDFYAQERDAFTIRVFLVLLPLIAGVIGWVIGKFV